MSYLLIVAKCPGLAGAVLEFGLSVADPGSASAHKKCLTQKVVRLDGFPKFKHHSIALVLLYNIRLERSFSIEQLLELVVDLHRMCGCHTHPLITPHACARGKVIGCVIVVVVVVVVIVVVVSTIIESKSIDCAMCMRGTVGRILIA